MRQSPERVKSRLLCPVRLDPESEYIACLVPSTRGGVAAGLGRVEDSARVYDPAWDARNPGNLVLPVYDHWEFRTGLAGDFETLVRRLTPRLLPNAAAGLGLTIGRRQFEGLAETDDSYFHTLLQTALRPPNSDPPALEDHQHLPALADRMETFLDQVAVAEIAEDVPIISPPRYGIRHAGRQGLPQPGAHPPWLRELNLDPRHRGAAGIGTRIVQKNQEAYMQQAWRQVGDIEAVNRLLARLQMDRDAANAVFTKLMGSDDGTLLMVSRPVHRRLRHLDDTQGRTLDAVARESSLPAGACSAAMRRLLRPRGTRLARWRLRVQSGETAFTQMRTGRIDLRVEEHQARHNNVFPVVDGNGNIIGLEGVPPDSSELPALRESLRQQVEKAKGDESDRGFGDAWKRHFQHLDALYGSALEAPKQPGRLDPAKARESLAFGLNPENVMPAYAVSLVGVPPALTDPDEPLLATTAFVVFLRTVCSEAS